MTAAGSVLGAMVTEGMRYVWVLSHVDREVALSVGGLAVAVAIVVAAASRKRARTRIPTTEPEVRVVSKRDVSGLIGRNRARR
jgi:ATP-dependent protease ClpP protease subunit